MESDKIRDKMRERREIEREPLSFRDDEDEKDGMIIMDATSPFIKSNVSEKI